MYVLKKFILFFILALVYLFPDCFRVLTHIFSVAEWPEDTLADLYGFWTSRNIFAHGIWPEFNSFIAAPVGIMAQSGFERITPFMTGLAYLLTSIIHEIPAYNLFALLGISLSAWSASILVEHATGNKGAGVFAGLIYGFSPNLIAQTLAGHLGCTHAQWIPLYILFLWKFFEAPSLKNGLFTGFFFALICLSFPYFGYFAFFFSLFFVFLRFFYFERGSKEMIKKIFGLGIIAFFGLILLLPFVGEIVLNVLPRSDVPSSALRAFMHPFEELFVYGARPWDYFIPSELNPVFGSLSSKIYRSIGGRLFFERTLYLGWVPLLWAAYGCWIWMRKKLTAENREKYFLVSAMIFCGLGMFFFSMKNSLNLGFFEIPMPSHFLYKIAPMFRVYARAGFFVSLCVACLAGIGLNEFFTRAKKIRTKWMIGGLSFGLLFLEYTVVPPIRNVDVSISRPVYQWIAQQQGDFIIAEYPLFNSINRQHYQYLSNQRFHGKRLMNGAPIFTLQEWLQNSNRNLWEEGVASRLSSLGVKYVVLHKEFYRKNLYDRVLRNKGFELIKEYGDDALFKVVEPPNDFFWILGNSYPSRLGVEEKLWSWFAGEGVFAFFNRVPERVTIDLEFRITTSQPKTEIDFVLEGQKIKHVAIDKDQTVRVHFEKIELKQGLSSILIRPLSDSPDFPRKPIVAVTDINLFIGTQPPQD